MNKKFPLTKKQFSAWVHAKPKRRYTGLADSNKHCPLAYALTELLPKAKLISGDYCVFVSYYIATISGEYYDLPKWAQKFVRAYDNREAGVKVTDLI